VAGERCALPARNKIRAAATLIRLAATESPVLRPRNCRGRGSILIEGNRDLDAARTAGFTVLVFAQLFNCFNARSERTSALRHLFADLWLWGAVALSVLLQVAVVNVGLLNVAFGTVPLELEQWLVCAAMASVVLWSAELRKLVLRAIGR